METKVTGQQRIPQFREIKTLDDLNKRLESELVVHIDIAKSGSKEKRSARKDRRNRARCEGQFAFISPDSSPSCSPQLLLTGLLGSNSKRKDSKTTERVFHFDLKAVDSDTNQPVYFERANTAPPVNKLVKVKLEPVIKPIQRTGDSPVLLLSSERLRPGNDCPSPHKLVFKLDDTEEDLRNPDNLHKTITSMREGKTHQERIDTNQDIEDFLQNCSPIMKFSRQKRGSEFNILKPTQFSNFGFDCISSQTKTIK